MSPDLPQYIEPARLAAHAESLEGTLGIHGMQRLRPLVSEPEAFIKFRLSFSRDEAGGTVITGEFSTELVLRCQRCLEPLAVTLEKAIRIGWVRNRAEADALPADLEPLLMEDNRIELLDLIEEEVLLGLPISPVHEPESCPATGLLEGLKQEKESPFAMLKDLKSNNH